MHTPVTIDSRTAWFVSIAWALITLKSLFVIWAVERYQLPFAASWIIAPTLVFGALATWLWLAHREE